MAQARLTSGFEPNRDSTSRATGRVTAHWLGLTPVGRPATVFVGDGVIPDAQARGSAAIMMAIFRARETTINLSLSVRKDSSVPRPGGSAFVSFPRHWLVSTEPCVWHGHDLTPPSAQTFRSHTPPSHCIHAHSDLFYHTNIRTCGALT